MSVVMTVSLTTRSQTRLPHLFDSWGRVNSEDASARLDNFANQLENESAATGSLVCYGPDGDGPGTGKFILRMMNDYLVNARGVGPDRIRTTYAGRYKTVGEPFIEAWIVPFGQSQTEPRRYGVKPAIKHGKIREFIASDDTSGIDECGCGPPQGDVELAAMAEAFRNQPHDLLYVVVYHLPTSAPGTWRRVGKAEIDNLKRYGLDSDRTKTIFAGFSKSVEQGEDSPGQAKIQLWVLPEIAPPPAKTAATEPMPTTAIKFGEYFDSSLAIAEEEKRVLDRIADVLQGNDLRICFIVRPSTLEISDTEQPTPDDLPHSVNMLKLIEKWKAELMSKSNIPASRILVIPATADEENEGTVELWLLPRGVGAPDPYSPRIPPKT